MRRGAVRTGVLLALGVAWLFGRPVVGVRVLSAGEMIFLGAPTRACSRRTSRAARIRLGSGAGPQGRAAPRGLVDERDLHRTRVIEGAPRPESPERPTPATITTDGDTRVMVTADSTRDGYLILGDTHYPGWKATVDGNDATTRPANFAFRAVAVPAGRHVVEFTSGRSRSSQAL